MSTPTIKQIPFSPNLSKNGLTSQVTGLGLLNENNSQVVSGGYVAQSQTPVTMTRNSEAVTQNPVTGNLTLADVNIPAFGGIGLQIGRQTDNSLDNSDFRNGTTGYTLTDTGGIVTAFTVDTSGIDESDTALRLTVNNTSGFVQIVEVHQSISGALSGESWVAQTSMLIEEQTGVTGSLLRIVDQDNATITSTQLPTSTKYFEQVFITQTLTGNSNDLRWNVQFQVPDTNTFDVLITNNVLALNPWPMHYIPSATGPTTRETDVVDVGTTGDQFFSHAVDEMWSIDFSTLGVLTTIAGASQLQYLFSTYSGVDGTSLFVDDVNTITWQADFNGSLEDVSVVVTGLGADPHRAYMRILDDGGGGYDREMFIENLVTGAITASTLLNTTNLPIQGDIMKIGRDNADANILDGFVGRLTFWGDRSNLSMNRINDNWPT